MISLEQELAKLSFQIREGEAGSAAGPCTIPVEVTEEHLVDRSKEAFDAPTAAWLAWVENTSRIFRSTATCSICFNVKSAPLSV